MNNLTKEDYVVLLEIVETDIQIWPVSDKRYEDLIELRRKLEFKVNTDKIGMP